MDHRNWEEGVNKVRRSSVRLSRSLRYPRLLDHLVSHSMCVEDEN